MIWLIFAGMIAIALVIILRPFLHHYEGSLSRTEYDTQIYKDQLAELKRDTERGVITEEAAGGAQTEIARRLLAVEKEAKATSDATAPPTSKVVTVIAGCMVPLLALGIYAIIGSPHLTSQSAPKPGPEAEAKPGPKIASTAPDKNAIMAQLSRRLKQRPDDLEGWKLFARTLANMRRFADAVTAYQQAIRLSPEDSNLWSQLAEAQIFAAGGSITPAVKSTIKKVMLINPNDPRARYYAGIAAREAGEIKKALKTWIALEADSQPNAPWRKLLGKRISQTAKDNGISGNALATIRKNLDTQKNNLLFGKTPLGGISGMALTGPTPEEVKEAQKLSGEDRLAMINNMVQQLADKMENDPKNVEGWIRLGRSYEVLNKHAKSRDAYSKAAALKPKNLLILTAYAVAIARAQKPDAAVPQELKNVSEQILALNPSHGTALWFSGIAMMEAGNRLGARDRWLQLLATLEPKGAKHSKVLEKIKSLGLPIKP